MYFTNKGRLLCLNKIKIFFKEQDFAIRVRTMYIKIDEISNMTKK